MLCVCRCISLWERVCTSLRRTSIVYHSVFTCLLVDVVLLVRSLARFYGGLDKCFADCERICRVLSNSIDK